ncbi:MAG: 1-phosphofructokinase family hexose kinase [Isosphaeraceae bacterium]
MTLNPCLDKTLKVPAWKPGDLVRGTEVREVVGGKGNNVARALTRLGRTARPVTFFGGPVGQHCAELLRRDDHLDPIAISSEAPTREILTVLTQSTTDQTAFFDPDPSITAAEADALVSRVEQALAQPGISALTLSGSSPSPATHGVYSDLISLARARRVPAFLDTYGPALETIWGFWPLVLQVNRKEAAGLLKKQSVNDDDVFRLLAEWRKHGVACGIVTDGPYPVLAQVREKRFRAVPPAIKVVNPIGSGDCLLAGLVDAWLAGADSEPLIRRAIACAAANCLVWDAGAIDPETADRLATEVMIEQLSRH